MSLWLRSYSVAAFYALLKRLFYSFRDAVRRNRRAILVRRLLHAQVEKIVHRVAEVLRLLRNNDEYPY